MTAVLRAGGRGRFPISQYNVLQAFIQPISLFFCVTLFCGFYSEQ
uniref:Uncharacterized protein n=1 Tax=Anguilla anguilla TaxID=7936 RepID=A0A0E9R3T9_ANGAN